MQSAVIQIKTAYEQARATNVQPTEALSLVLHEFEGMEETALKAALMQVSTVYRKDCGQEDDCDDGLNFSNDQLRQVNQQIFQLAMAAEDENVRTKNLHYIRDDKKGRRDTVRHLRDTANTFNILQFNESIKGARSMVQQMKDSLVEV